MKKSNGALEKRAAEALNMVMSEYQVSHIITDAEKRLIDLSNLIETKKEPLQKAFEAYTKLQDEFDAINAKLHEDQALLDNMTRYKNGIGKHKPLRLMRSESHNDMKDREKNKLEKTRIVQFTWTSYAEQVLKEQNKMLTEDELWEIVVDKFDIAERAIQIGKTAGSLRYSAVVVCWTNNCAVTKAGTKMSESRGKLFEYKGYIGIKEWATEDFKPKPEYAPKAVLKAAV